jgi:hypothetical protein
MSLRAYPDWVQIPYHLLPIVMYGMLIWIGILLHDEYQKRHWFDISHIGHALILAACILCAWESSELAQIIVRWHDYAPLWPYENVIGLHVVTGWVVYLLHAGRIIGSVILMIAGKPK